MLSRDGYSRVTPDIGICLRLEMRLKLPLQQFESRELGQGPGFCA
jgi:hypothetical protein